MRCDDLADVLATVADASSTGSPSVDQGMDMDMDKVSRRHVEQCLRCQAELVQYRRLLSALRSLRTEVLEPAPGLLSEILATVEEAGERTAVRALLSGRRAAYLGGLAAATAAGAAAGAIVLATRSRRGRLPLAG